MHDCRRLPDGQITSDLRKSCQAQNKKYFAFPEGQIRGINHAILSHQEGRSRSSRNAGQGAVDAEVPITNGAEAYGKDVWS